MGRWVSHIENNGCHLEKGVVEIALQAARLVPVNFGYSLRSINRYVVWSDSNKVAMSFMLLHDCGGSTRVSTLFGEPEAAEFCAEGAGISPEWREE